MLAEGKADCVHGTLSLKENFIFDCELQDSKPHEKAMNVDFDEQLGITEIFDGIEIMFELIPACKCKGYSEYLWFTAKPHSSLVSMLLKKKKF